MELSLDDIAILVKGLDALETSASKDVAMDSMFNAMFAGMGKDGYEREAAIEKQKKETAAAMRALEVKTRQTKDDCCLVRAKLVMLRRALESSAASEFLANAQG